MQHLVALALLGIGFSSLLLALVTGACARAVLRRASSTGPTPPVSILKPLKGADGDLFDNLESLVLQDYPCFELVLGCEDAMDPALGVARRLQREHPNVSMTLVAGGRPIGFNPKVNNLVHLTAAARYDWVLVSDADVRADPGYLRALAAETADPRVGLVSSIIAGVGERSLGAALDNLHLNGFVASTVSGAQVLAGHPCVVGKSMLFRRSDLARLGGWAVVKDVLAEDYVLGQEFRDAGFRVALSGHPVHAVSGARRFGAFWSRHLRWAQMRRHIAPWLHLGEPLLLPTPWLVGAAALALGSRPASSDGTTIVVLASLGLGCKAASDALLAQHLRGGPARLTHILLIPLKDLIVLFAWLLAWWKSTVSWRGNVLQLGPGSALTPLHSPPSEATARYETS